jgi:hypothetical protein
MSTNEPPVDPTANPVGWRSPAEPSGEPVGSEAIHAGSDSAPRSDEPPVWTPPAPHGEPGSHSGSGTGDDTGSIGSGGAGSGNGATTGSTGPGATGETPASASGWAPGVGAAGAAGAATGGIGHPAPPGPPSYTPPPTAVSPGPRKRPAVVVAAAAILLALAICSLGHSVLGLVSLGSTVDRFKERARVIGAAGSDIDAAVSQMRVSYIFAVLFAVLFAVVLAGLAYGLLKGSNGARIATWVISGIAILCDCCSTLFYFGANGINITTGGQNDLQAQLAQAQLDAFPAWFLATAGGISLLQLLGYIAVAVLLALPAANAFFKKVAPGWLPPTS